MQSLGGVNQLYRFSNLHFPPVGILSLVSQLVRRYLVDQIPSELHLRWYFFHLAYSLTTIKHNKLTLRGTSAYPFALALLSLRLYCSLSRSCAIWNFEPPIYSTHFLLDNSIISGVSVFWTHHIPVWDELFWDNAFNLHDRVALFPP